MSENIIANLEEMQVYLRNNVQEILICKHKKSDALYLVNTFFKTDIFEGADLQKLKNDIMGIERIEQTDGEIKIFTRYYFYPTIKDAINQMDKVTLERQVAYTGYILDRLLKLKHLPTSVLDSLFNSSHIVLDDKNKLQMLGSIIVNPDYNSITSQDIFRRIGKLIHIIFSGKEIEGGEIDSSVPPDIKGIINDCLTNKYFNYEELLTDYKESSVYKLMNPESEEGKSVHRIRKNLTNKTRFHSFKKKGLKVAIILILLLPVIVFAGGKLLDFVGDNLDSEIDTPVAKNQDIIIDNIEEETEVSEDAPKAIEEENDENDMTKEDSTKEDSTKESNSTQDSTNADKPKPSNQDKIRFRNSEGITDDLDRFYNENLLEIGRNENLGIIDSSEKYSGVHSIKVSNGENTSTLVGAMDLNADGFSFLKNRKNIDVSMWTKSNRNVDAVVTLKLIGDNNKILAQASKEVYISNRGWSLNSLKVNTTDGNYIKVYITPKGKGDIWVDSIEGEILK